MSLIQPLPLFNLLRTSAWNSRFSWFPRKRWIIRMNYSSHHLNMHIKQNWGYSFSHFFPRNPADNRWGGRSKNGTTIKKPGRLEKMSFFLKLEFDRFECHCKLTYLVWCLVTPWECWDTQNISSPQHLILSVKHRGSIYTENIKTAFCFHTYTKNVISKV